MPAWHRPPWVQPACLPNNSIQDPPTPFSPTLPRALGGTVGHSTFTALIEESRFVLYALHAPQKGCRGAEKSPSLSWLRHEWESVVVWRANPVGPCRTRFVGTPRHCQIISQAAKACVVYRWSPSDSSGWFGGHQRPMIRKGKGIHLLPS